jgi:hypothetical protein
MYPLKEFHSHTMLFKREVNCLILCIFYRSIFTSVVKARMPTVGFFLLHIVYKYNDILDNRNLFIDIYEILSN